MISRRFGWRLEPRFVIALVGIVSVVLLTIYNSDGTTSTTLVFCCRFLGYF